jgi:hypothetical protein
MLSGLLRVHFAVLEAFHGTTNRVRDSEACIAQQQNKRANAPCLVAGAGAHSINSLRHGAKYAKM